MKIALIACACFTLQLVALSSANAKDFVFGGRTTPCTEAVKYREKDLFIAFVSAVDNFDKTKEERINAAIQGFKADVAALTKDIDKADKAKAKRIVIAVAGVVLGMTASKYATVGVKQTLSATEKQAMAAVAGRGAEWYSTFLKYGANGEVDVLTIATMPASILLSFSPFGVAQKVWALGPATIDVATAIAEAELVKGEAKLTASMIQNRSEELVRKLQMPKIAEINRLKSEIDKQCGS